MPSEILWRAVLFLFVHCATILFWLFLDNAKKRRRPRKKIFICADCWLLVFDFLAPSQLGHGIALISRRFDLRVDEHFKTRKWMLNKQLKIQWKIGKNGTKKMQIVDVDKRKALPFPQKPLTNKVIGFSKCIRIIYIDQKVLTFLGHFHRFFAAYTMDLEIVTENGRILEFVLHNIWPMFRDSMRYLFLNAIAFHRMCQLDSSMLTDCPALYYVSFNDDILPEFPIHDIANPSDGQAVAKWLLTPRPDGVPKWLKCSVNSSVAQWSSTIEQFKTAFSTASSPVTFRIRLKCSSTLIDSVLPFDLINEVTGEQLELQQYGTNNFRLSRCPIGWDQMKWENVWNELSAARPKRISIRIRDDGFDEGVLNAASPGPRDH